MLSILQTASNDGLYVLQGIFLVKTFQVLVCGHKRNYTN
ncbi:hypothetical protein ADIS_4674 [Lunatimonas lonarensis]|uniref:Uncharacterized protein n=1 Tax=Lunatimonas lonarensis TaxID=1232681 RepID=R7ZL93_9BACT|nr:hypothetical protein ADIS_4674 [Lunatimonas lonarensis]